MLNALNSLMVLLVFTVVSAIPLVLVNVLAPRDMTTLSGEGVSSAVASISDLIVNRAEFDRGSGPCISTAPSSCENCQVLAEMDPSLR